MHNRLVRRATQQVTSLILMENTVVRYKLKRLEISTSQTPPSLSLIANIHTQKLIHLSDHTISTSNNNIRM